MREIRLKAMAKINLGLDVLRRREDGYHEVRMIMQTVRLHDRIRLQATKAPGIRMEVSLGYLPCGPDNLAWKAAAETCLAAGAPDVFLSDTAERNESIWSARGAFLEAIKASTTEMDECDVVVPRSHVAEFVLFSREVQKRHNVRIRSFGHAGDGNLHIYVLRDDLAEDAWKRTLAAVFEELYAKARELGGQVSGEHGIGYAKKPYLRESLDPVVRALMRGVKDVFDPHHILNPGKVID